MLSTQTSDGCSVGIVRLKTKCNGVCFLFVIILSAMLGGSPCHHSMACPRVADGRDGLQLEVSCEYIE
jgi:hypothetical protein